MTADSWLVLAVWAGLMVYALSGTQFIRRLLPAYQLLRDLVKWLIERRNKR